MDHCLQLTHQFLHFTSYTLTEKMSIELLNAINDSNNRCLYENAKWLSQLNHLLSQSNSHEQFNSNTKQSVHNQLSSSSIVPSPLATWCKSLIDCREYRRAAWHLQQKHQLSI